MELERFYRNIAGLYPECTPCRTFSPAYNLENRRPAELFQPRDSRECVTALNLARQYGIPVNFLGVFNVLAADQSQRPGYPDQGP